MQTQKNLRLFFGYKMSIIRKKIPSERTRRTIQSFRKEFRGNHRYFGTIYIHAFVGFDETRGRIILFVQNSFTSIKPGFLVVEEFFHEYKTQNAANLRNQKT